MTPGSFDPTTARSMVGDAQSRAIEAKARADADQEAFDPPQVTGATYFEQVQSSMRLVVYREQFSKRLARNQRKK